MAPGHQIDYESFPESAADVVRKVADAVNRLATVNPVLDLIKGMLGDPGAVMAACDLWDPTAQTMVTNSSKNITNLTKQITDTWTGDAAKHFTEFMVGGKGTHGVIQTIDDTSDVLSKISTSLFGLYGVILGTYKQCIGHLGDCSKTLLKLLSKISAAAGDNISIKGFTLKVDIIAAGADLEKAINDALSEFITIVDKVYNNAIDDLLKNQKTLHEMMDTVARMPEPDQIPDTVEDSSLFYPK
jgi:hypothetical protein